ncbi:hypothetical protein E2C01_007282 [Portunus trituberculatus]|uniref:Uncharacterized protein n=1 Tax=Portunus trituberculatus TaxID=210409 RepID=A0A5B7CZQ6_PORTR|nr:hypothetical protein [Portunus trituberculatus]
MEIQKGVPEFTSKRYPVHGPSVGWASSLGAMVSYRTCSDVAPCPASTPSPFPSPCHPCLPATPLLNIQELGYTPPSCSSTPPTSPLTLSPSISLSPTINQNKARK